MFVKVKGIKKRKEILDLYENGYVFCSDKGEDQEGGYYSPIVVLKEDGSVIDMPQFVVNGTGKELKSHEI